MDQAWIGGFTLAYIATLMVVFLMCLPGIITFAVLLLTAGAARLISFLLTALTIGLYRALTGSPERTPGV